MRESLTVLARGVLATLLAVLTSWLSTATPVLASTPEAPSGATYTYLASVIVATPVDHVSERGPPTYAHAAAHRAMNARSHGASASLCTATPFTTTAYNVPSTLVPAAGSTATTRGHVEVEVGDLSVFPGSMVAANPAIGFAEGLGKTALTPGRLQHGTKNLTKAGVLPACSGKNSPGIIERAFVPILERPTATFDHTLGETRVRGFLGDIDGNQVALFVYKEGPYQGQLASSSVPSANQLKIWGVP